MSVILLEALVLVFFYVCLVFVFSVVFKRNDVADIAWGGGYVVVCIYLMMSRDAYGVSQLVYMLVILWGLRLAIHVFLRNRKKSEDCRYKQWREKWGKTFLLRSFLQVYLLQGALMLLVMAPVFVVAQTWGAPLTFLGAVGFFLWCVGFYFEAMGDYQLTTFLNDPKNKGKIMTQGLWKLSRHPNYFGEITMWWGLFLIVCTLPFGLWAIISPLTITILFLFVSGIPMAERRYEGNKEFDAYKKKTRALLPLPKW